MTVTIVFNYILLPVTGHSAKKVKSWRVTPLIIPAHIGSCSPTGDYKTRQVQYAASHLWWKLHIPFSFRHGAPVLVQVPWQVSLPVGFSTGPSAFGFLGILRNPLVSHRYFSQFQVVTKMDDPFPSVEKWSWKAFEMQKPQVVGIAVDSTLTAAQSTAVCSVLECFTSQS